MEHCVHEQDFGALKETVHRIDKEVFGNGKEGLAQTIPAMNTKIDTLIEAVGDLRTATSGFTQYIAGETAVRNERAKGWTKTAQVVALAISLLGVTIAFWGMSAKTTRDVKDIVDQYGYDMKARGFESDTL